MFFFQVPTSFDVLKNYLDMVFPVGSGMFVKEAQGMRYFMFNSSSPFTTSANRDFLHSSSWVATDARIATMKN